MLARRQQAIKRVAAVKARTSAPLRDALREARQIARLAERARAEDLDELFVARIFREIVDFSVRTAGGPAERKRRPVTPGAPIAVVFQGSEGAFSHIAGRRFFAPRQAMSPTAGCRRSAAFSKKSEPGAADYAMLPIENTTSGSVHDAYDALSHTDLAIVGEDVLRIELCLVGIADVPLESLRSACTRIRRPCRSARRSSRRCRTCTVESFTDTAMSVERVKLEDDPTHACIASAEAAALHGLHVLRRDIANHRENYTRFLVIAREPEPWDPRVPCKTSVMFVTKHERGALLACLNVLAGSQPEPDEARIASAPGAAVRVPVLRGLRRQRGRRQRPARRGRDQRG